MNALSMSHRKKLERTAATARRVAERGASAVEALAVQHREPKADPARIEAVVRLADQIALRYGAEFAERQQRFTDSLANNLVLDDLSIEVRQCQFVACVSTACSHLRQSRPRSSCEI